MIEDSPIMSFIRQELILLIYRKFLKRMTESKKFVKIYKNNISYKLLKIFSQLYNYLTIYGNKKTDYLIPYITKIYNDKDDITNIKNTIKHAGIYDVEKFIRNTINDINNISLLCERIKQDLSKYPSKYSSNLEFVKINNEFSMFILHVSYPTIKDHIIQIRHIDSLPNNTYYGNMYNPLFQYYDKKIIEFIKFNSNLSINFFTPFIRINNKYTEKLKKIYRGAEDKFEERLFCMLARYETFTYSDTGLQGTLTNDTFNKIKKIYNIDTECFASPLNCTLKKYYSAFPDTDKYFGSIGSFFDDFFPKYGNFEANPPFISSIMNAMADRFEYLLKNTTKSILFFVVVPTWKNSEFYTKMSNSKYLIEKNEINSKDHHYVSGLKYKTDQDLWLLNVSTTWFLLQNTVI